MEMMLWSGYENVRIGGGFWVWEEPSFSWWIAECGM